MSLLLINFKLYEEVSGEKGRKLAEHAKKVSSRLGLNIVIAPPHPDIRLIAGVVPVVAQHIDPVEPGARTGYVNAESVKAAGAIGAMINHSEKKLSFSDTEKCLLMARKNGLMTICCAATPEESAQLARLGPDYILIEPPELIGSEKSVSKTRPEVISNTVNAVKSINPNVAVICGAGVSTGEDALIARNLGAIGVAAASAIAKAKNPERVIEDIANGLI